MHRFFASCFFPVTVPRVCNMCLYTEIPDIHYFDVFHSRVRFDISSRSLSANRGNNFIAERYFH